MVSIKNKNKNKNSYDYPNKKHDLNIIDKFIQEDFKKFCKEHKLIKSYLVEKFYKSVLIRFREGSLINSGYVTIKILD